MLDVFDYGNGPALMTHYGARGRDRAIPYVYVMTQETQKFWFSRCDRSEHGEVSAENCTIKKQLKIKEDSMSKGTVKWFNADKGFGFITPEDGGKDLFVHYSEIQSDGGYATLSDGQAVEYEIGEGQKGPCANKVVAVWLLRQVQLNSSKNGVDSNFLTVACCAVIRSTQVQSRGAWMRIDGSAILWKTYYRLEVSCRVVVGAI